MFIKASENINTLFLKQKQAANWIGHDRSINKSNRKQLKHSKEACCVQVITSRREKLQPLSTF